VRRLALAAARGVALLAVAVLFTVTALLAGIAVTGLSTLAMGGRLDWALRDVGPLAARTAATAVSPLPYLCVTRRLAVLTRSAIAALSQALGYALLVEGIALPVLQVFGGPLAQLAAYTPGGLAAGLTLLQAFPFNSRLAHGLAVRALVGGADLCTPPKP